MFKGIGDPWVRTTAYDGTLPEDQRLLILGLLSFELAAESTPKESQKFNSSGELVSASTVKGATAFTFTLSYNEIEWGNLGFALNQFPRIATSVNIPQLKYATVPLTSPYTVADAAIVVGNADDISVSITASGSAGQAGQWFVVVGAAPDPGEVQVGTGLLTFNAAQAGAEIAYPLYSPYATVQDLGGPSGGESWGEFEFFGKILVPSVTAGLIIHIPKATIAEDPSITIDDSVPTVAVVCGMGTPTGWDKPYRLFNMSTATV